jgi:DNA-binding CsgD family transcriptional regulator
MTGSSGRRSGSGRGASARARLRSGRRRHRDYCRRRSRQIAYGRWQPWADATPVRAHLRTLRAGGASYEAIARAAGVSPATVHRLLHRDRLSKAGASGRVRSAPAMRLLAVTTVMVNDSFPRRDAIGTRRRLQALIAMGHPEAGLARRLGMTPLTVSGIVRGATLTVTPATHAAVCELYGHLWDQPPGERTPAERRAAAVARRRAARHGWPAPMGLDDDRIDDPGYRPRTRWRPATGSPGTPPVGYHPQAPRSGHAPSPRARGEGAP